VTKTRQGRALLGISASLLLTAMLAGCNEREQIFSRLALVVGGLHYPGSQEALAACRSTNDEACLKAYTQVASAKKALFSRPRRQALQLVAESLQQQ
jgi:hypothetical protein